MIKMIQVTQTFKDKNEGFTKGNSKIGIRTRKDGIHVTALNTIVEFPELFPVKTINLIDCDPDIDFFNEE